MPAISVELTNTSGLEPSDFEAVIIDFFNDVVESTPVRTGHAQDGWDYTFEDIDNARVWNDVEYISYLEDGWSSQAPNGMVGPALDRLRAKVSALVS